MASWKKTGEEEKDKKKFKQTKPTKLDGKNKKKRNSSPKKPENHKNNNHKTNNGAMKEPEVGVAVPSSSADSQQEPESQEESEQEQEEKRSEEATSQRSKSKKPKKSSQKQEEDDEDEKVCRFPTRRIWRIVKSQSSDSAITGEAVFLVNKATEKFLEQFCEDGYAQCVKDRKKSLSYQHLASVVSKQRRYDFLSDFVPEKIKAEAALADSKLTEKGAG